MAVTEGTLRGGAELAKTPRERKALYTCTLPPIGEMSEDTPFFDLEDNERVAAWVPFAANELLSKSSLSPMSFAILTHYVTVLISRFRGILQDPFNQDGHRPIVYRFARQIIPVVWGGYMQDEDFNPVERFAHVYQIVRDLVDICLKIDVDYIPTETRRVSYTYQWTETKSSDKLQTSLGDSPENLKMLKYHCHNPRALVPKILVYRSGSTIAAPRFTEGVMGNDLKSALLSTLTDLESLHATMLENMDGNRRLESKETFERDELIWSTPLLGLNIGGVRCPAYVNPTKVMLSDCWMPVTLQKSQKKDFQDFCSSGIQSSSRDALVAAMNSFKLNANTGGIQKRRHVPKTRSPLRKMQLACENACQYDADFERFVNHERPPINNSPGCIWIFE